MQILLCSFTLTFTVLLLYTTINAEVKNLLPEHGKIVEVLRTSKPSLSFARNIGTDCKSIFQNTGFVLFGYLYYKLIDAFSIINKNKHQN